MKQLKLEQVARTAVVVATVILAACGGGSDSPINVAQPYPVTLSSFGGSAVNGTAVIEDNSGPTSTVRIELAGMAPQSAHVGHVHRGSCAQQGAILFGLEVVTAGADGRGTATTAQVPDNLLTGEYYIQYHVSVNPPGDPIACGDIPDVVPDDGIYNLR